MTSKCACLEDAYGRIKDVRCQISLIAEDLSFGHMDTEDGDETYAKTLEILQKTRNTVEELRHGLVTLLGQTVLESDR